MELSFHLPVIIWKALRWDRATVEKRTDIRKTLQQTCDTLKLLRRSIAAVDNEYVLHDLGALLSVAEQEALTRLRENEGRA